MSTAVEIVALQTPSLEGTGLSTLYIRAVNEPSRSLKFHNYGEGLLDTILKRSQWMSGSWTFVSSSTIQGSLGAPPCWCHAVIFQP